jgi:hypothetical protein
VSEFRCGEAVGSGTPSAGSAAHEFCNPARIWDDVLKNALSWVSVGGVLGSDPILLMLLSFLWVPVKWLYKTVDRMYCWACRSYLETKLNSFVRVLRR